MFQVLKIWINVLIALVIFVVNGMAFASDNFVKVNLPKGVSIELPKNWVVLSGKQRIALDSTVKSVLDLSGIEQERSELPFVANYYDDKGNVIGILNIRYYPEMELTQDDAQGTTPEEVKELDVALKENALQSIKAFGMKITSWKGTQKFSMNGITVFLSEYRRNSQKEIGEFRVRLVKVLDGHKSFTLTVSYHDAAFSYLLKPITDRIIHSLNIEGVKKNNSVIDARSSNNESQNSSIMTKLYGENGGLALLLSFLFTWGIGLVPPLLIRFVFFSRPMKKGWAIGVAALFWIVNIVIFTSIGSQSKTHFALVLIAFVSYAILRKGANKQVAPTQTE